MPESFVQVAPDSTGKRLRTFERDIGGGLTAHDQFVLQGGLPTYYVMTPFRANGTTAANFLDIFNAVGSGVTVILKKLFIQAYVPTAAMTARNDVFTVNRTTTVGTGGTAITPRSADSTDPALPAGVTARHLFTGGAAVAWSWMTVPFYMEETYAGFGIDKMFSVMPEGNETRDVHLNPGEGLSVTQAASVAATGSGYSMLAVICTTA